MIDTLTRFGLVHSDKYEYQYVFTSSMKLKVEDQK